MALQELHSNGKVQWPGDARIAILLSFDFQGGEDVKPDKNGRVNHEEYTQGEYGPNTGIWRILRILSNHEVKATFLTCGGSPNVILKLWPRSSLKAMKSPVMVITMKWRGI
jgi:hypothetical protein